VKPYDRAITLQLTYITFPLLPFTEASRSIEYSEDLRAVAYIHNERPPGRPRVIADMGYLFYSIWLFVLVSATGRCERPLFGHY
jgi:hypothetical protein